MIMGGGEKLMCSDIWGTFDIVVVVQMLKSLPLHNDRFDETSLNKSLATGSSKMFKLSIEGPN